MRNENVYLRKLKLPEKYIEEPSIALMLQKPGTLSKKEKEWLRAYVSLLELRDIKPEISREKLSEAFKRKIEENKNGNIYSK